MSDEASVDRMSASLARAIPAGARVAEILDAAMDAILIVDAKRTIALANHAAGRVFGHAPDALMGRSLSILIPPTARPIHDRQVSDFLKDGRSERGHRAGFVTGVHADGHELALDVTISRIHAWEAGAAVAVIRDASDRLAQEKVLRDNDLRFRLVAQASGDVLYEWRVDGGIQWFGDAITRVLGHDGDGARDYDWWRAQVHPEDLSRVTTSLVAFTASTRTEWSEEYRFRRGDGQYATVINRTTSARDDGGRVVHTIGALMDVSALRAAEAARHALEIQLQQAQKMEAIGRLAGGIAHDFNNLLTVIIGNTALVQNALRKGEALESEVADTMTAAQRAADLTRQLLAFARRQVISPRVIELNGASEGAMRLVTRLLGEKILAEWQPSPVPLFARVDPAQFELLLVNLAVNARDAMPSGGTLRVQLTEASPDEVAPSVPPLTPNARYARCEVRDSGTGIPADVIPHVFEPFFTTKERGKGTGLGLSTCYGIVQQAGGHIRVHSQAGDGTSFVFLLPITDERELPETPAPSPVPARGSETILLVEDEPAVLTLFSIVLRRMGYHVLATRSPDEALTVMASRGEPVDVLVTDVALPRMSGIDLARTLRARGLVPRILFVSGHADELVDGSEGTPADAVFVAKPITGEALAQRIRELLDQPSAPP